MENTEETEQGRLRYIYRMTHIPTGRTYVGQRLCPLGKTPETDGYYGSGKVWKNIYKSHPVEEFKKEILDNAFTVEVINVKEKFWVAEERKLNPGGCVNLAEGGSGRSGVRHSEEVKKKISNFHKERCKQPGVREKMSRASKGFWTNHPEHRQAVSKRTKKMWETSEYRQRFSDARRKMWENANYRQKMSKKSKEMWESTEYREKMSTILKEVMAEPEYRQKKSKVEKEKWEDPQYRELQSKSRKEVWSNPRHREHQSKARKEMWKRPGQREKFSNARKKQWQNLEYRQSAVLASRKRWEDPEYRQKVIDGRKKQWENPEYRLKMSAFQEQRRAKIRDEFYAVPHSEEEIALFEKSEKRKELARLRYRKYYARKKALANPDSKP